ncbi:DUF1360 domain-containing protein [Mycobacterium phage Dori]|uniref:DUF1360 domain-containing protein n=1 Tax=Mycobacterium phage Dori TaxID=1089121 RepID=UPI000232F48A|nr:DUF1360 domain-containing protein [Mycobacterium phage Dori]AER47657.1 hypothetical protein DORI_6 [Mycobacterium phage Dori]
MNLGLGVTVLILVVYVLAVARVTRLINYDVVLDFARLWVARRAGSALTAAEEAESADQWTVGELHRNRHARWNVVLEFMGCPWCVGWWVALAGAVPVVIVLEWSWWALVPVALACSYLVGLVAPLTADEIDVEQA